MAEVLDQLLDSNTLMVERQFLALLVPELDCRSAGNCCLDSA